MRFRPGKLAQLRRATLAIAVLLGTFFPILTANPSNAAATFTVNGSSVTGSINYTYTSMAAGSQYTFNFTGSDWATMKVKLYGAGGGHTNGAAGGYVEGVIDVRNIPNKTFTIVVGGAGGVGNSSSGYNGGGSGWDWGGGTSAGGGGGATDLRLNWTTVGDYSNANRILVAGGGGGGTGNGGVLGGTGAYPSGNASTAYNTFVANGGTQSAGGSPSGSSYSSAAVGGFGTGGTGYGGANNGVDSEWNGGGGGGYYGGAAHSNHGGGGGGSSYYNSTYVSSFTHTSGGGSAKQTAGSATVQILTSGFSVPDAPTIGTASVVDSSTATISYTAPASNGGDTITSFTAISTPDSITASLSQATSGTITISGLTPGTNYTFMVRATNGTGNSLYSASSNSISLPKATTRITLSVAQNPAIYRTQTNLTFTTNFPGKVVFTFQGKAIPGCKGLAVSTSITCPWKPSTRSTQLIGASFVPTNSNRNSTPAPAYLNVGVTPRSTNR